MEKAKRARTAETQKQPSLRLRSSAPELYSTGRGRVRVVTHGLNLPRHGTETARRLAGLTQSGVRAAHKAVIPAGESPVLGIVCSLR